MKKVVIEFQYFEGCPNYKQLYDNLSNAIKGLEDKIILRKTQIENEEDAIRLKFRGSPTLLIDNQDIENMPIPDFPTLACRFYPDGIPDTEIIKNKIIERIKTL